MKILQITYSLASGGAERFVVDMCNELIKNLNNEVYLLVINDLSIPQYCHYLPELSKKVKCLNVGTKKGLCPKSVVGVYKTIKKIKPDIVHAHCDLTLLYLPALLYKKAKYIHTLHNVAEKAISFKWLRKFQGWLFRKNVQPITISNICQQSYIDFYKQDNAICITNGRAKLETTTEYPMVKKEIETYKQGQTLPVFIHVARFDKQKNQKRLFDAIEKLHKCGKEFLLVVIGRNYENSPHMILNETDYIKIIGAKNNVADYLACADYFLLSSDWEGLPLAMLEAMSMGCIPISTPAGGVVDVIKNGENGLLCPTFDTTDYYKTIEKVFAKDFAISKERVINDYKDNYTMEVCVNKYYDVYKQMCQNKR